MKTKSWEEKKTSLLKLCMPCVLCHADTDAKQVSWNYWKYFIMWWHFLASAVHHSNVIFFMILFYFYFYLIHNKQQMSPGFISETDFLSRGPAGRGNGMRRHYRTLSGIDRSFVGSASDKWTSLTLHRVRHPAKILSSSIMFPENCFSPEQTKRYFLIMQLSNSAITRFRHQKSNLWCWEQSTYHLSVRN